MLQAAPPALWSSKKSVDKGDNSAEETWGANRKAGCPSGLDPFARRSRYEVHPTATVTKKTLFQAIEWRLEQGQQIFFKIWVFEGKRGGRPNGRRPGRGPGSSAGSQSRRKSRLLTCPATSLCIEGITWE